MSAESVLNIAGYKFVSLDNLKARRLDLLQRCKESSIKGTILLSEEGINLFLAGSPDSVGSFLEHLRSQAEFADFLVKESFSDRQPFNRLLVRIKQEIIAFGVDNIDPANRTSPKLKPAELKRWLDEGKPVTLFDVRNNYEVELGTFENAVVADIDHFRQFPDSLEQIRQTAGDDPIVMFCTGGIRCEKAGPFMEQQGFENIYQLDGGILQYFEDCGDAHYSGDCFVFDQRVAVDANLNETEAQVCFACQAVVTPDMSSSSRYVPGVSCPSCYRSPSEQSAKLRDDRLASFRKICTPLPGSVPYDNYRPLNVPRRFDGQTLLEFLCNYHSHVRPAIWQQKIQSGQILLNETVLAHDHRVREGQRIEHLIPATVEPDVSANIDLLYEDECLVAIHKPAPLPMHPSGRFNRNTLTWILDQVYDHQLRAAHRLDANTTGVVVFSRTRKIAAIVQPQFEQQTVKKTYLALVHGTPDDEFMVDAAITDQPSAAGGRRTAISGGKECRTEFRVLQRISGANPQALVMAKPVTGRTNQIRIHLWHTGFPVVGDPTYLPHGKTAAKQTLSTTDPPMCLHAWRIEITHPVLRKRMEFVASPPTWATIRNDLQAT